MAQPDGIPTLTGKLLRLLATFALIPTIVVGLASAWILGTRLEREADARLRSSCHEARARVDDYLLGRLILARIIGRHATLRAAAGQPARASDPTVSTALRETALDDPVNTVSCAIVSLDGRVIASTLVGERDADEARVSYLQLCLEAGGPVLSIGLEPGTDRAAYLYVASPLRDDDNRPVGVLRWKLYASVFDQLLALEDDAASGAERVLRVPDGAVLSCTAYERALAPALPTLPAERSTWIPLERDRWRVIASPLRTMPWQVLTLQPADFWNPVGRWLWFVTLGTLAAVSAIIVLVSLRAAHAFSRPINALAAAVENLELDSLELGPLAARDTCETVRLEQGFRAVLGRLRTSRAQEQTAHAELAAAQRRLAEREAYYRQLFDSSPDAIAVVHARRITDVNAHYRERFGEGPALPFPRDASGGLAAELARHLERAERGETRRFELELHDRAGRSFGADVLLGRIGAEADGQLVLIVRDVTRRRELEDQLKQSYKMDAVGQLAGGLAHDFNNMLGVIIPAADMLSTRVGEDGTVRRLLDGIRQAAGQAESLTQKLLAFSRKGRVISIPVDLHAVIDDVVGLLERSLDRRIAIEREHAAARAVVVGDPNQLEGALLNLGINARDAMPEGGRLCFRTARLQLEEPRTMSGHFVLDTGAYVQVEVRDTGRGIDPRVIDRVFEPFFTTKAPGKGTGLGLSAVFGAVEQHRGGIEVESGPEGTVFTILLPATDGTPPTPRPEPVPADRGKGRILVVDDEEIVRYTTATVLEDLGYEVLTAQDGADAVARYAAEGDAIDLVVIDHVMPILNGVDAAEQIRALDPAARIVLCSGFTREAAVADALGGGIDEFLQKPFKIAELSRVIGKLLGTDAAG